tara:strand:+ start:83 stop:292 length:210 start_codon:yes stop_codon:yes gene_type:complete
VKNFILLYSIYIILQNYFCGAWRSLVARPAGGREVVGSNPAAPTIKELENKNEKNLSYNNFDAFFISGV